MFTNPNGVAPRLNPKHNVHPIRDRAGGRKPDEYKRRIIIATAQFRWGEAAKEPASTQGWWSEAPAELFTLGLKRLALPSGSDSHFTNFVGWRSPANRVG